MASKFSKVMLGSDDEKHGVGEQVADERFSGADSPVEFGGGVDHRVDLALQLLLRGVEGFYGVAEGGVADDEQVNVAVGVFFAARQRAENQRQLGWRGEALQRVGQNADRTAGFAEESSQLRENRVVEVGPVAHLIALLFPQQQPAGGQSGEFLVQRARRGTRQPRQFAHVVAAARMQEQLGQCALAIGAEEEVE